MTTDLLHSGVSTKPELSKSNIVDIIYKYYGLNVQSVSQLNGYDDLNFHITEEENCENENIDKVNRNGYVLKIINNLDSMNPILFQAQNQLLLHLGAQGICCPRSIPTKEKTLFVSTTLSSGDHIVRLLDFIPGKTLNQVLPSTECFYDCGKYVARLGLALKDFHHPIYNTHRTVWHLQSVVELSQLLFVLTDPHEKELVRDVINEFRKTVLPLHDQLEKGMIHGDFNEHNILVEKDDENNGWKVKGILDFGDSHNSCYLYDLAIAITYMILQAKSIDVGQFVIEGYNLVRKIPNLEYSLLKVCIAARFCQSLVLGAYSIQLHPENEYLLITSKPGWVLLEELWKTPKEKLFSKWNILNI